MNSQNETLQTIHSLRSTHGNFSDRAVSREDLQTIVEAAVRAANASARQSYAIVVIEDRDQIVHLCGYGARAALLFCLDYTRIADTAAHLGHSFSAEGIGSFVVGSIDTILAAQTAAIAARSLGIDSLFTNGIHRGDMNRVYEALDLPTAYCFPLILLALGYADQEPAYMKGRLSGPGVVHWGRYHRLEEKELQALVEQYDDPQAHLGLTEEWRGKHAHYLDWFYTVWIGRGGPRTGVSPMYSLLEQVGFLEHAE